MSGVIISEPEHEPTPSKKICLCISPSVSGVVSLCVQFITLVVTMLVCIFLFYHAGGYEYMGWNENSTMFDPITYEAYLDRLSDLPVGLPEYATNVDENNSRNDTSDTFLTNATTSNELEMTDGDNTTEYDYGAHLLAFANHTRTELEMLELARLSTLVYFVICILWFMSLFLLLTSIKYEILDLVCVNSFILTVASLYALMHALFVCVLLYYQPQTSWRTLAIVTGSVIVLMAGTMLGGFALHLDITWYKYIVHVHGQEKFLLMDWVVGLIKCKKCSTTEATQPSLTYQRGSEPGGSNDQVVFSAF